MPSIIHFNYLALNANIPHKTERAFLKNDFITISNIIVLPVTMEAAMTVTSSHKLWLLTDLTLHLSTQVGGWYFHSIVS